MALALATLNRYLTLGAITAFAASIAPFSSFATVVKPGACAKGDLVRVPYATNNSGSSTFTYETGYTGDSNQITGKPITLDTILYQPIRMNDSDLSLLNPEALQAVGAIAGANLAADFMAFCITSSMTQANFPQSGSATNPLTSSANYTSSAGLAYLDKAANDLKWPDAGRTLIASSTLWNSLMNNSTITNAANFGNVGPIQQGKLNSVLGFVPYKTTVPLPIFSVGPAITGFAANPNGLLIGNGYHAPQDSGMNYIAADQLTWEGSDLTFGFRQWYEPGKATSMRVFDILGGSAAGNPNGVIWIK